MDQAAASFSDAPVLSAASSSVAQPSGPGFRFRLRAALLISLCFAPAGCGKSDAQPRQRLEGSVTIDGHPLEKALITFIPIPPTEGPKASGVVNNGKYVIERSDGPHCGRFLVKIETVPTEIEAVVAGKRGDKLPTDAKRPRPTVAVKYNRDSELKVVVREGSNNRFQFEVESDEGNVRPR